MTIGRVDKYGVPISTENDTRAPLIQPKFVNRFRIFLYDFGDGKSSVTRNEEEGTTSIDKNSEIGSNAVTSMVESFNRPAINFGTQEATSFIGRAKYSGRMKHENFTFVLRDDISNSVISKVYAQAKKQAYKFHPITRGFQKSPYLGMDTKFLIILQLMDGRTNHKSLETWKFYGCSIENIETSGSTYEDGANVSKITVTCACDHFDVSQEKRLILPSSFEYDNADPDTSVDLSDSLDGRGANTPGAIARTGTLDGRGANTPGAIARTGTLDGRGANTPGANPRSDSGDSLVKKAKESYSDFFQDDDDDDSGISDFTGAFGF